MVAVEQARRRARVWWFLVELAASVLTLAGMLIGSSTFNGAAAYLVAQPFWFAIIFGRGLWGLMPIATMATIIAIANIARATA